MAVIFTQKQSRIIWASAFFIFTAFIALFSYLYPLTADDVLNIKAPLQVIGDFFFYALTYNPKIGSLISLSFIYLGKNFFVLFNPFMQLAGVLLSFFIICGRAPAFDKVSDIPAFALICLLFVFACAAPDNTLFWLVGACTYSWTMVLFLGTLALLRAALDGKIEAKHSLYFYAALAALGVATGMTNENNGPMALILCCLFFAWQKYKKAKVQPWFYVLAFGVAAGVALLFLAPGSYNRLSILRYDYFRNATLMQKLFWNLSYQQDLIKAALGLPLAAIVANIVALFDDKRDFKNKDLWLAFIFGGGYFVLALALSLAPKPPLRAFYSASIFGIIGFIFTIKYWGKIYKVNLIKYAFFTVLTYCFVAAPVFAVPYFNLHKQEVLRNARVAREKAKGNTAIALPKYIVLRGPSDNLTIQFYDVLLSPSDYIKTNLNFDYKEEAAAHENREPNISPVI